jgi:hypothetical protein
MHPRAIAETTGPTSPNLRKRMWSLRVIQQPNLPHFSASTSPCAIRALARAILQSVDRGGFTAERRHRNVAGRLATWFREFTRRKASAWTLKAAK